MTVIPIRVLLVGICLWMSAGHAAGVLRLNHTSVTIGSEFHRLQLEAENVGDSALYLDVTQELVQLPLTEPEVRIPLGEIPSPSLLVSPARLTLGPGQKRAMNLTVLRIPQRRKIWRVTFRPHENISVSARGEPEGRQVPFALSIGYGVVIYQQGDDQ